MLDLIEDIKTEKLVEPPKGWRNWYKVIVARINWSEGRLRHLRGDILSGDKTWPSKDAAETAAQEYMGATPATEKGLSRPRIDLYEYLGAFPEGERP